VATLFWNGAWAEHCGISSKLLVVSRKGWGLWFGWKTPCVLLLRGTILRLQTSVRKFEAITGLWCPSMFWAARALHCCQQYALAGVYGWLGFFTGVQLSWASWPFLLWSSRFGFTIESCGSSARWCSRTAGKGSLIAERGIFINDNVTGIDDCNYSSSTRNS